MKVQVLITVEAEEDIDIPKAMYYLIGAPLKMRDGESVLKIVSIDGEVAPYTQPT